MEKNNTCLIVCSVNDGFSSDVIKYANEIAEVPAIVLKGRGIAENSQESKMIISPTKDVVLIHVSLEQKKDIMKNIGDHLGLDTKAQGVLFSIGVEDFYVNEEIIEKIDSEEYEDLESKNC